eukprot:PLAT7884.2.p1 GENE.PLAT7884.2~~PLAT7884.2.p1  ORF type:complete len:533 (-),score=234.98 PLAT7884.2:59-1657(-)
MLRSDDIAELLERDELPERSLWHAVWSLARSSWRGEDGSAAWPAQTDAVALLGKRMADAPPEVRAKKLRKLLSALMLPYERITSLDGAQAFSCLREINLRCNALTRLSALPPTLVVAHLYGNSIDAIGGEGGESLHLPQLEHLGLAYNRLTSLDSLRRLRAPALLSLDMSYNPITQLPPSCAPLRAFPTLGQLYMNGCPVALTAGFRAYVLACCPSLLRLDDVDVSEDDKTAAAALRGEDSSSPHDEDALVWTPPESPPPHTVRFHVRLSRMHWLPLPSAAEEAEAAAAAAAGAAGGGESSSGRGRSRKGGRGKGGRSGKGGREEADSADSGPTEEDYARGYSLSYSYQIALRGPLSHCMKSQVKQLQEPLQFAVAGDISLPPTEALTHSLYFESVRVELIELAHASRVERPDESSGKAGGDDEDDGPAEPPPALPEDSEEVIGDLRLDLRSLLDASSAAGFQLDSLLSLKRPPAAPLPTGVRRGQHPHMEVEMMLVRDVEEEVEVAEKEAEEGKEGADGEDDEAEGDGGRE